MITVEQLIGDLLLRHNCVIVPSFGGFVAKQVPAVIDHQKGTMQPPRKSLLFNRQLINNDGLLVAELALQNKLNYNEAVAEVAGKVETWNEILRKGERITLDRVGYLFFDQERNICFEQDRFFNLLLESYGLGAVHFLAESDVKQVQKRTIELEVSEPEVKRASIVFDAEAIREIPAEKEQKIIEHPALRSKTKVWKYVAAACLLPVAFYSFWIPVKTDVLESGVISVKDFNPFYHHREGAYSRKEMKADQQKEDYKTLEEVVAELPGDVEVFSYQYDEDLYIPVRIPKMEEPSEDTEVQVEPSTGSTVSGNFDYIVGCFSSTDNARNLVAAMQSKGLEARIVDVTNGLTRISAGNADSQEALQQIIQQANSLGYTGWILKK